MRLNPEQQSAIKETLRQYFGESAEIYIYGSRLDDHAQGGDIDILVEADTPVPLMQRLRAKDSLQKLLYLPVDLMVKQRENPPTTFQSLILQNSISLK